MGFSTMQKGIYHLKGIVKHYDWGGFSFIPSLLNLDNNGESPFAEYWLGVHPLGTSLIEINGGFKLLSEVEPSLSFLFKVLDVNQMLSIQVHPTKQGAIEGFNEEEHKGLAIDSPYRNYKDRNHKPELMVALSDFWLLHGFKPAKELEFVLLNVVELRDLLPVFNREGYAGLYRHVMEMPQEDVNRMLEPLIRNISEVYRNSEPDKDDEDYWVSRASKLFCHPGHIDRGIFSIYFLNLVHLRKGEGIFQAPGVPHAYLEGKNIEIMANSDNVLRGGLTNKHISVPDLLKHVQYDPVYPQILHGTDKNTIEKIYEVPVDDFTLTSIELKKGESLAQQFDTPGILLLTEGEAEIESALMRLKMHFGNPSVFINSGTTIKISTESACRLFKASTA